MDVVLPAVRGRDAGALLAAVLERVEPEVGEVRRFGVTVHAEDAAGVVVAIGLAGGGELRRRVAAHQLLQRRFHQLCSSRRGMARAHTASMSASSTSIQGAVPGARMHQARTARRADATRGNIGRPRAFQQRVAVAGRDEHAARRLAEEQRVGADAVGQLDRWRRRARRPDR